MKRFLILLAALLPPAALAPPAFPAVEFKVSGHMHVLLGVQDNGKGLGPERPDAGWSQFDKNLPEDNFYAGQRFRPKLSMNAGGVSAVFEAEQYAAYWGSDWPMGGNPGISGASDGEDASVRIRQAYLDFKLPGTPVSLKVGYQQFNLPSIWESPLLNARIGGAVLSLPLGERAALSLFYARPWQYLEGPPDPDPSHNSDDMFGFILPLDFKTVKVAPYFMYVRIGDDEARSFNDQLYAGGFNLEVLPTEALSFKLDAIFTQYEHNWDDWEWHESRGWFLATAVDYELSWGRPGLFAWYATGGDSDKDDKGIFYDSYSEGFGPTSLGTHGYASFAMGDWVSRDGAGTWGAGAQLADFSFIDGLKHTLRLAYIRGTNEVIGEKPFTVQGYFTRWTTDDWFVELNLDSDWRIYENLSVVTELGAILPHVEKGWGLSAELNASGNPISRQYDQRDDLAWRAQVVLMFNF